jgi:hypothetical protein
VSLGESIRPPKLSDLRENASPHVVPGPKTPGQIPGVVLPPGGAGDLAKREIEKHGAWEPTKEDIDGLEVSLGQVSQLKPEDWPASSSVRIEHPERYFRQYVGVVRGGKKMIYVNAFCSEIAPLDWQKRLVVILDGGACVWQAIYDPSAKRFRSLRINGVA